VLVVLAGLLGLLAYGLVQTDPDRSVDRALEAGEREEAPELELPRLSGGGTGSLADYRGEVVVLNFWASWCKPCKEESPLLERWHRKIRSQGGLVLGVDMLDVTAHAEEFIDEYGLTYPMLKDKDGEGLERYGVVQYPETFAIDRQGRIAAAQRGPVDEAWMKANVEPLL
jgi:cytochrome c biogenesis protein CcmG/thiol:disulfide interchange protein DsbE